MYEKGLERLVLSLSAVKLLVMEITKEDVAEFQQLYKKKFDIELDYQDALKMLTMLVRQMQIVYQPITKDEYSRYMTEESN